MRGIFSKIVLTAWESAQSVGNVFWRVGGIIRSPSSLKNQVKFYIYIDKIPRSAKMVK